MLLTALHYASICSYVSTLHYAQNYASIIRQGLMGMGYLWLGWDGTFMAQMGGAFMA